MDGNTVNDDAVGQGHMPGFLNKNALTLESERSALYPPISSRYCIMLTLQQIEAIFENIGKGDAPKFFEHVDDNVAWTVKDIIFDGRNRAAVELKAVDVKCKNGLAFTNEYVWVCHFSEDNKITKINALMGT
ncbi:hypothetical protein SLS59_000680 [Nothophoma quercina]|uniref:Uncharacterized protein n=1 Tax=Nothophoma quercina TaxID=749835 RepID=A0ABR3S3F7_9PLEO